MARGVDGRDVFNDDHDRRAFLDAMSRVANQSHADIIAHCLMGNHFHLAIKVATAPLSAIMHRILGGYVRTFNPRHQRTGHLFQARYKSLLCFNDPYLARLIRYIHMNPVRAGLVANPVDWPWSSAARFGEASCDLTGFDPWRNEHSGPSLIRIQQEKIEIDVLAEELAARAQISIDAIRSKNRERGLVAVRRQLAGDAVANGHTLTEVARWLNKSVVSVSDYCRKLKTESLAPDYFSRAPVSE